MAYPDSHRARSMVHYLPNLGWEPILLAYDPEKMDGHRDEQLAESLPQDLKTHFIGTLPKQPFKTLGINSIDMRSLGHFLFKARKVIKQERPDIIFFSNTVFIQFALAGLLRNVLKQPVPIVFDFQDPWYTDEPIDGKGIYQTRRYKLSRAMAGWLEPKAIKAADGIIVVSDSYTEMFKNRYQELNEDNFLHLPFGAGENDFQSLEQMDVGNKYFDKSDGRRHWVYVGRCGELMEHSLSSLFRALQLAREEHPRKIENLRLHFIGTNYAHGEQAAKTVEPIADKYNVADLIYENPNRIPYFEALRCIKDADALLMPGTKDFTYTASKLFPYILADKPLLLIFHENSNVLSFSRQLSAGTAVAFEDSLNVESTARVILERWITPTDLPHPKYDRSAFSQFTSETMTNRVVEFFESCLLRVVNSRGVAN